MGMLVDANGRIAGRLSTRIAKALINGEKVILINAEGALIIGTKEDILEKFRRKIDASVKSNPDYGPKYDRIPSRMLKKMVKGMLPNKSRTVERLLKNLKVYNAVPKEMKDKKFDDVGAEKYDERHDFMTLKEIACMFGGRW
ncbi:MAG: 50S ribosomal protein L13 [Candidatus Diapherotrites archaeon]|nr:50S ribosomal protein L13 [Candidatus Diapherotrites archaeon]